MVTHLLKYMRAQLFKKITIPARGPHSTVIDMPRLYFIVRFPHHSPPSHETKGTLICSPFCTEGNTGPGKWHFHAQGHPVDWGQLCQTWAAAPDIGMGRLKCGPCGIFGTDWETSYREHPIEDIL